MPTAEPLTATTAEEVVDHTGLPVVASAPDPSAWRQPATCTSVG